MTTTTTHLTRCPVCETLFRGTNPRSKYCGDNCRRIAARLAYDPKKNAERCANWRKANAEYLRLFKRIKKRTANTSTVPNLDRTICSECGKKGETFLFHYSTVPGCARAVCPDCFYHLRGKVYNYRTLGYKEAYEVVKAASLELAEEAMEAVAKGGC